MEGDIASCHHPGHGEIVILEKSSPPSIVTAEISQEVGRCKCDAGLKRGTSIYGLAEQVDRAGFE
jgi:hypothetical protein